MLPIHRPMRRAQVRSKSNIQDQGKPWGSSPPSAIQGGKKSQNESPSRRGGVVISLHENDSMFRNRFFLKGFNLYKMSETS